MFRSLITIGLLIPSVALAAPVRVIPHNERLDLVGRFERHTIRKDIERVQSHRHITRDYCVTLPNHVPAHDPLESDINACEQYFGIVGVNYSEIGRFRSQWYCATGKDKTKCVSSLRLTW